MHLYHHFKNKFIKRILKLQKRYEQFRSEISARRYMKSLMQKYDLPKLSTEEIREAKSFYRARGYKLKNTYWHQYYKGMNGKFHKNYIPYDIFNPRINPKLNQRRQWPALLDKNLTYNLFKGFDQPKLVVQNINGFFYVNDKIVDLKEAVQTCEAVKVKLIIKPTIDTGSGKMVNAFSIKNTKTTYKNYAVEKLFQLYKKDFVVQEFLEQSEVLKSLNPSSLNTLRIVSYLNDDGVHILASVLRVGKSGSSTDNFSTGGLFCGISKDGKLKGKGYGPKGDVITKTSTGIILRDCSLPNYKKVQEMVKSMHYVVPYFKIISWDIGISKNDLPFLIEYNTLKQGIDLQIAAGPYLGEFTDEILALGLEPF